MHIDASLRTPPRLRRTRDLRAAGWRERDIAAAVRTGRLLRLRQGAYAPAEADPGCAEAGRLGGRLTCLSELARLGVFVLENRALHVHLPASAARPSTAHRLVRLHWQRLRRDPHPQALSVEPFDAVRHAVLCQSRRAAIATIDSALHLGVIRPDELDELFDSLPRRFRTIRRRLDSRADSGSESLMRLILRGLHCPFEPQVRIEDVGTVDFLVDGWLIVECDSRLTTPTGRPSVGIADATRLRQRSATSSTAPSRRTSCGARTSFGTRSKASSAAGDAAEPNDRWRTQEEPHHHGRSASVRVEFS